MSAENHVFLRRRRQARNYFVYTHPAFVPVDRHVGSSSRRYPRSAFSIRRFRLEIQGRLRKRRVGNSVAKSRPGYPVAETVICSPAPRTLLRARSPTFCNVPNVTGIALSMYALTETGRWRPVTIRKEQPSSGPGVNV